MTEATDPDSAPQAPTDVRTDRAHTARMYDYLLGGKDNYLVDREAAENVLAVHPNGRHAARSNRSFMHRAARFLANNAIDQYLDVGTGIPTEPNLHQVVQEIHPTAHLVYVDNDPIVLAHAAALMVSDPRGKVTYVHADARSPEAILNSAQLRETLDLTRPVGISTVALLHWLDDDSAARLVHTLLDVVPSGSYLLMSHGTADADESVRDAGNQYGIAGIRNWPRSRAEIEKLFLSGLELVDPGITFTHQWRPDSELASTGNVDSVFYALVARKP